MSDDFGGDQQMAPYRGDADDLEGGSWEGSRQHVFAELRRHAAKGHDDRNSLQATRLELAIVTTKVAVWGIVFGAISGIASGVVGSLIVYAVTKKAPQ